MKFIVSYKFTLFLKLFSTHIAREKGASCWQDSVCESRRSGSPLFSVCLPNPSPPFLPSFFSTFRRCPAVRVDVEEWWNLDRPNVAVGQKQQQQNSSKQQQLPVSKERNWPRPKAGLQWPCGRRRQKRGVAQSLPQLIPPSNWCSNAEFFRGTCCVILWSDAPPSLWDGTCVNHKKCQNSNKDSCMAFWAENVQTGGIVKMGNFAVYLCVSIIAFGVQLCPFSLGIHLKEILVLKK